PTLTAPRGRPPLPSPSWPRPYHLPHRPARRPLRPPYPFRRRPDQPSTSLLYQQFAEQHVIDPNRARRVVNAHQQFFLKPEDTLRTAEVLFAKFTQVNLEIIHDPRDQQLEIGNERRVGKLKRHADLQKAARRAAG